MRRFLVRLEKETTAATAKESHRVLRSALSSACREELITRNVAKLVEPPRTDNRELKPWSLDETLAFLAASRKDPLYAAFVIAIAMGLRRGEIIGLRWSDLDLENRVLYVRQQTQRRRGVSRRRLNSGSGSLSVPEPTEGHHDRDHERPHAARRTRLRSRSKLARPNICRLSILILLLWPSTAPEL
ncbi:tyrosine-type recombinase/integrase [Streptomyces sp. MNU76]|nr:tyrosine-type recombinase/integrase [Streptomyces sp. MNU76]MCC9710282.1 tyrosine-type recombinase/integrase [Streptomyces sp. MNU76]